MRAVGAAAAGSAGAGAAASLVGVVETATLKFNAAGRERLGRRGTAAGAHDLWLERVNGRPTDLQQLSCKGRAANLEG